MKSVERPCEHFRRRPTGFPADSFAAHVDLLQEALAIS